MKKFTSILVLCLLIVLPASAQNQWEKRFKTYQNPDELITMSENLPFNQAIDLLSKVSESVTGKRIVSSVERTDPIGVEIVNMLYDKALLVIVQYAGLEYDTKEDLIVIRKHQVGDVKKTAETYAAVTSREVKISAVFFDVDVENSRKIGMDWEFLLSNAKHDLSGVLRGEAKGTGEASTLPPDFNLGATSDVRIGDFSGEASAIFKFFETNGLGEIIASPNITVRDRNKGKIQIGSDFSVVTTDFAGNTIQKFFPTGTIIEVTPYVYNEDGIDYILLDISVERSTFSINGSTTEVKKTNATTQVLMLDGEETVIGGLFSNEETVTRNGIPFLKDLPWWVLGIRFITGSDETVVRKKELVILLKTDLVPTLKERFENPDNDHLIKKEREKRNGEILYHKFDNVTGEQ
jgi:Flp pilus assembly secretin CpaC